TAELQGPDAVGRDPVHGAGTQRRLAVAYGMREQNMTKWLPAGKSDSSPRRLQYSLQQHSQSGGGRLARSATHRSIGDAAQIDAASAPVSRGERGLAQ